MNKPKYKSIDGVRYCLISYDIMLNHGTRFFKTVTDYFPMQYDLELGMWFTKANFAKDAKARFESLAKKEFTIAFNQV